MDASPSGKRRRVDAADDDGPVLTEKTSSDDHWLTLKTKIFVGQRQGLVGPKTWKFVTPVVGRRLPDEIFSCIRGCGFLSDVCREQTERSILELRRCPDLATKGWQEFCGRLSPIEGLSHAGHVVVDFVQEKAKPSSSMRAGLLDSALDDEDSVATAANPCCRRICYRINAEGSGIEVRLDVNLHLAFQLMLHGIRHPASGYEADWQIREGSPPELSNRSRPKDCFRLLDNKADLMHPQPCGFKLRLRPEQLRSLQWMAQQEAESTPLTVVYRCFWQRALACQDAPRSLAIDWTLDCRIITSFNVRGGVLADEIGYGKTALAIALIDVRQKEALPSLPPQDENFFFHCPATLVCVPSHLHAQWVDEFAKFTGKRLKILRFCSNLDMKKATVKKIMESDVVLCDYQLLRGPHYAKRRQELSEKAGLAVPKSDVEKFQKASREVPLEELPRGTFAFLRQPETHAWSSFMEAPSAGADNSLPWQRLRFPVLEQFFWRRVVFDEFHELEGLQSVQQSTLRFLRAHHRWGLTGTPLLGSARHVATMASLLQIDVAGPGAWDMNDHDPVLVENCCRFLDACVRQNSAELPKIRTVEHLKLVRHTPQERALYLAASHTPAVGFGEVAGETAELRRRRQLLILCSHFSEDALLAAAAQSAGDECGRLLSLRQQDAAKAKEAVQGAVNWLEALRRLGVKSDETFRTRLEELCGAAEEKQRISDLLEEARKQASSRELESLAADLKGSEGWKLPLRRALAAAQKGKDQKPSEDILMENLSQGEEELLEALKKMQDAEGRLSFLQRTLALIAEGSDASTRSCSICYDDNLPLEQLGITPCAHVFCLRCLHEQVQRNGNCGICRQALTPKDVQPVMAEIPSEEQKEEEARVVDKESEKHSQLRKFGSKLYDIVLQLKQIKREDASAKCIVFCQWESLLQNIAAAFKDFGIRHARLQGSVYARTRTLAMFKAADSDVDVLLLSLEQSASGTNLTSANHVLLVHPMNAQTREQSVAFELQAIGRVRRWGQTRSEVHVWRFCTLGTVEEEITRQHQKEIYDSGVQSASSSAASSQAASSQAVSSQAVSSQAASGQAVGGQAKAAHPETGRRGGRGRGRVSVARTAAAPAQWACPACTLLNDPGALLCNACAGPRPGLGRSDGSVAGRWRKRLSSGSQRETTCIDLDATSSSSSSDSSSPSSDSEEETAHGHG